MRPARTAHLYPPDTCYWEDTREEKGPRHNGYLLFTGGEHATLSDRVDPVSKHARFLDPEGVLGKLIESAARSGVPTLPSILESSYDMLIRNLPYPFRW